MVYSYMDKPLEGDVHAFLQEISDRFESGEMGAAEYHVAPGKAMGYVECRFSGGRMSEICAYMLLHEIERLAQL